jgi:hypothetical protein
MPDAFGTIPAPGSTVLAEARPGDVLASYSPPPLLKGGTIKANQTSTGCPTGIVLAGQALDYEAGTKKYIITAAGTAAIGVLLQSVDTSKGDALGNVLLSATVKAKKVLGFGGTVSGTYPNLTITALGNIAGLSGRTIVRSVGGVDDYIKF